MSETDTAAGKAKEPEYDAGHIPMTEELDDAKHSLPNLVPVVIALAVIAVVIAAAAYLLRSKPVANGSIQSAYAVEQNTHNTSFVAINVSVQNVGEKPLFIKDIRAEITIPGGSFVDDAANAADYARYTAAYPELKTGIKEPLKVETRIAPGASAEGTVLVNFPITKADFDKHTNLVVTVIPYDHPSIHLTAK